jgi:YD repeat-containing protein
VTTAPGSGKVTGRNGERGHPAWLAMTSPDEVTYDRMRLNRCNLLRLAGIARAWPRLRLHLDIRSARGRGHELGRETVAGEHIHRLQIFRLVEPGSIVCFFPASVTWRYPRPRKDSRTDPDNRATSSHIDPAGPILTSGDPANRITTFDYDKAGQTKSATYADGVTPNVTYGYDPAGHLVTMTDGTGTSTWNYDTFGELTSRTQGSDATIGYGYDNNGNQTSITYPGQTTPVVHTFDDAERLKTVTDWSGNKTVFGLTTTASSRPRPTPTAQRSPTATTTRPADLHQRGHRIHRGAVDDVRT